MLFISFLHYHSYIFQKRVFIILYNNAKWTDMCGGWLPTIPMTTLHTVGYEWTGTQPVEED